MITAGNVYTSRIKAARIKAMILAAGLGTRLLPITSDKPKALVPVNGIPIIIKQIENLLYNNVSDITIISGYRAEKLFNVIHPRFPQVSIIESVNYSTTNNMYSALLGRKNISDGSFIMMNADVFFDASAINALLNCDHENAIITDIGAYNEESMKVVEENGRIVEISKSILREKALGSSIDVYKFSKEGGKAFFDKCYDYIYNKSQLKLWSEVAINDILQDIEFYACPLVGRWYEIDNHEDLAAAERLFS